MLHVEIVLKAKQPEAETSLVYDVFIRVIRNERKKKNKKHVKHVKIKEVLRFICGLMKQG